MKQVLLVDDNEAQLFAFKQLTRSCEFSVDTANSIKAAFDLLSRFRFDVVISDLNLTSISGHEGFDIVKQAKTVNAATRTFILTAYDGQLERQTAGEIGVEGFWAKPVPFAKLRSTIEAEPPL